LHMLSVCIDSNLAIELSGCWLSGHGRPRDLADVATEVMLAMDSQPGVPQQQAVLAGIASATQLQHQQVTSHKQSKHAELRYSVQSTHTQAG
jgi:hypothetical protein